MMPLSRSICAGPHRATENEEVSLGSTPRTYARKAVVVVVVEAVVVLRSRVLVLAWTS